MQKLIDAKYYEKDMVQEMDVAVYRSLLIKVLKIKGTNVPEQLEDIYELVLNAKAIGLDSLLDSSKYYMDYDKVTKKYTQYFRIKDHGDMLDMFRIKYNVTKLDLDNVDFSKLVTVCKFFKYIADSYEDSDVTIDMIKEAVDYKSLFKDLTSTNFNESRMVVSNTKLQNYMNTQKTYVESVALFADRYIKFLPNGEYFNSYGNILKGFDVKLNKKDGSIEGMIYIPMLVDGKYSLSTNKFVQNKFVDEINSPQRWILNRLPVILSFIKNMVSVYYTSSSKDNEWIIETIQRKINSLFYDKQSVSYKDEYTKEDEETSLSLFTMVENKTEKFSNYKLLTEVHKFYHKEYRTKFTGGEVLDRMVKGRKGYENLAHFPLSNKGLDLFDPNMAPPKSNFEIMYLNDNNIPMSTLSSAFSFYNMKSVRNALDAHVKTHAFKLGNIRGDKDLVVHPDGNLDVDGYYLWFAFMQLDKPTSDGYITHDGIRVMTKEGLGRLEQYYENGTKILFNGVDKGVSVMTNDKFYFIHNNKRIYLNVANMTNVGSRENFGPYIEAAYNAKKYLDNNLVQEVRDVTVKPILNEEICHPQDIFTEDANGNSRLVGKHQVGLIKSFIVNEAESTYSNEDEENTQKEFRYSYKLGLEFMSRLKLMPNAKDILEYLFDPEKISREQTKAILAKKKLYGKYGRITTSYIRELPGLTSTAIPNAVLDLNEIRILVTRKELDSVLKNIFGKVNKHMKESILMGKKVELKPMLMVRNPSVDDANGIYVKGHIELTTNKYDTTTRIENNAITWARQGGDYDGDNIILMFLPHRLRKSLELNFDIVNHEDSLTKEFEYSNIKQESSNTFEEALLNAIYIKKGDVTKAKEILAKVYDGNQFNAIPKESIRSITSANRLTTMISKKLIGISKNITMKALFFIEDLMNQIKPSEELDVLKVRLRKVADAMNYELVQPTIDIQKWSDDLNKVIETVMLVYRMSEAVDAIIMGSYYPSYFAFTKIINSPKGYYEIIKAALPKEVIRHVESSVKTIYDKLGNSSEVYVYQKDLRHWFKESKNLETVANLIEVINPKGKLYQDIKKQTKDEISSVDVNKLFFVK